MKRDFTHLYSGGVLYQSMFSSMAVGKKCGNSSYLCSMIGEEKEILNNTSDRMGGDILRTRQRAKELIDQVHLTRTHSKATYILPPNTSSDGTIAGFDLFNRFQKYYLINQHNF